jgi:hypothetical protein
MILLLVNQLLVNRVAKIKIQIKLFLENVEKFHNWLKISFFWPEIRLLFTDLFRIRFRIRIRIRFRIRIRIRIRNVYFGSGSDPDPAKSFGSLRIRFRFRIRIRNTAFNDILRLKTKTRPLQWYHSQADLIWPDGPFRSFCTIILQIWLQFYKHSSSVRYTLYRRIVYFALQHTVLWYSTNNLSFICRTKHFFYCCHWYSYSSSSFIYLSSLYTLQVHQIIYYMNA